MRAKLSPLFYRLAPCIDAAGTEEGMTALNRKPWFRMLAVAGVIAAGLAVPVLLSAPAQARVVVGFGFVVPGFWGYYSPAYYYPYPAYYPYPYYYGYRYAVPAGVYFGHPFYRHPHPRWHRRWR
jgi:hypothetical protein